MQLPKTPSFRLDGRNALVTGASRGIGLAAAAALAEAGAHVIACARTRETLDEVVEALREQGGEASSLVLDVSDTERTERILQEQPPLHVLVNNAGVARPARMVDVTPEIFDAVMDVNVRAAYFVARGVVRNMLAAGVSGSIINMSSQMGHVGGVDRTVYCASKFALEGISKALAIEVGENNIRVNTLCPTFIRTPLGEITLNDPERRAWIMSKIKLGRVGEVEDLMGAITFLASDAAAMITGSSLMVDGGWTAG